MDISDVGVKALLDAYRSHGALWWNKKDEIWPYKEVGRNRFGDVSTLADHVAEETIIKCLQANKVKCRIVSEESGEFDIGRRPELTVIIDGIDGSDLMIKDGRTARYGTMLGIYEGLDPTFDDYLFSGIMDHSAGKLFFAKKGTAQVIGPDRVLHQLKTSTCFCSDDARMFYDESAMRHVEFGRLLSKQKMLSRGSSAVHYADLAAGEADVIFEGTRKMNLELAAGFGLINEAGGIIVDKEGNRMGKKRYHAFAKEHTFVVGASNCYLLDVMMRRLR